MNDNQPWDLVTPMREGRRCIVRIPAPYTAQDLDDLQEYIAINFDHARKVLARIEAAAREDAASPTPKSEKPTGQPDGTAPEPAHTEVESTHAQGE